MDLSALQAFQGGGAAAGGTTLCEVRAGLMTRSGTTVTSDKRKGMVRLFKGADQILHFAWRERKKTEMELDLMLFPGDAEVFPLPQPPATGRCFALRFKTSSGIHFFWLQDPKNEKDEQLYKDMNVALGNAVAEASSSAAADATPASGDSEEEAALAAALAMSMEADSEGASTPAAAAPASTPAAPPKPPAGAAAEEEDDEAAALEAALAMSMEADEGEGGEDDAAAGDEDAELAAALAMSMEADGGSAAPAPSTGGAASGGVGLSPALQNLIQNIQSQSQGGGERLSLNAVMDSQRLIDAIREDTAVQDMLVVHMPEELQTRGELMVFISSPQFRQTIDSLATVLSSEQMYTILSSMGISPSAAPFPGVEGFLQALIATLSKKEAAPDASAAKAEQDLDDDLYD